MKKFNLDRLNAKMIKLGESPIKLKRTTYRGPIIKNEMLKGKDGSEVGTKGAFIKVAKVIDVDMNTEAKAGGNYEHQKGKQNIHRIKLSLPLALPNLDKKK